MNPAMQVPRLVRLFAPLVAVPGLRVADPNASLPEFNRECRGEGQVGKKSDGLFPLTPALSLGEKVTAETVRAMKERP